jgi:DNA-binding transcriptional LysR family regulator
MIYPTVKQFRAFVAVSQTGSFVRAADLLNLSQPALSETIVQLERILGGSLFKRTTRTLVITPFGEALLPRARGVIGEIERVCHDMREMTDLARGQVSIGCLTSIASQQLPQIIVAFRERHPGIRLRVRDENAAGLNRRLLAGEIDFAVTSRLEGSGGVAFQPLITDPFRLLCPVDHPLAMADAVPWRSVAAHFYLGWGEETANRFAIDAALAAVGIQLRPDLEISQLGTMLSMIERGVGIGTVPQLACPASRRFVSVALVEPIVTRDVGIASRAGHPLTPAAEKFMAMVTADFSTSSPR